MLVAMQVREPRAVLKEFGTELPSDVAVHVHDSTADLRCYKPKPDAPFCHHASATLNWRSTAAVHSDAQLHSGHDALPRQASVTEIAIAYCNWHGAYQCQPPQDETSVLHCRYIVIPKRPAGTEGWSADQLKALVTRDSMIGVVPARSP